MTQDERIIAYIKEHGSITPMEAWSYLGITKLATRVSYMINVKGIRFSKEYVKGKNRYGDRVSFMRYRLEE